MRNDFIYIYIYIRIYLNYPNYNYYVITRNIDTLALRSFSLYVLSYVSISTQPIHLKQNTYFIIKFVAKLLIYLFLKQSKVHNFCRINIFFKPNICIYDIKEMLSRYEVMALNIKIKYLKCIGI